MNNDAGRWNTMKPNEVKEELQAFGKFLSLTLLERTERDGQPSYLYRLQFSNGEVVQRYVSTGALARGSGRGWP